jgi:hypothetical protein
MELGPNIKRLSVISSDFSRCKAQEALLHNIFTYEILDCQSTSQENRLHISRPDRPTFGHKTNFGQQRQR